MLELVLTQARGFAGSRDWDRAGSAYAKAASMATDLRAPGPARRAWDAAAEAFRRADQPRLARQALGAALALPPGPDSDPSEDVLMRVRLAGCLGELGNTVAARQTAAEAVERARGPLRAVALDTLIGAVLGIGAKAEVRPWVAELDVLEPLAGGFRRAQLARLDGDLDAAEAALVGVEHRLRGHVGEVEGQAAVASERAENEVLGGAPREAIAVFLAARDRHAAAGRRALAWRCESGRIRAMVEAGLSVFDCGLDRPIAESEARGMPLLEADLRIGRALAEPRLAPEDLDRAILLADRCDDRLRAGRARLERLRRTELPTVQRASLRARAAIDLADHVILSRWLAAVE